MFRDQREYVNLQIWVVRGNGLKYFIMKSSIVADKEIKSMSATQ